MFLQFPFLFYCACAKSSILSIPTKRVSISAVLFNFNIILPLWILFNVLRSSQMNKVSSPNNLLV